MEEESRTQHLRPEELRQSQDADEDEEEDDRTQGQQKRKYPIKYIENKTRRHVTFAKRRHGIMKKAYELSVLTGANVLLLVLSNNGLVYTFTTPKLERVVREEEGKQLVWRCLNGRPTT